MQLPIKYLLETRIRENRTSRTIKTFCYGKKDENSLHQILTLDVEFSEEVNTVNQILKKIAFLFDELELEVSKNNQILKVLNISSIQKRWIELQIEILSKNQGYELEQYCKNISDVLKDEERLIKFLSQYNMLGMLFNGRTKSDDFFKFEDSQLLEGFLEIKENNHTTTFHSIQYLGSE